jgi:hypothetical protein
MKLTKYIIILTLFFASCTDFGDINVDPDVSPSANNKEVLTSAQGYLSWVLDGQLNNRAALWAQYWTWGPGVALGNNERYTAEPVDFNNVWTRAYANALADLKFLQKSGDKTYSGISKIMQANTFQILVDHFGDVPFSESIKGEVADGANFAPKYDDDKVVYAALIPMLDEGIADLKAGSSNPGTADLMYGGDVSKWIKFANSLKLRILMRQSVTGDKNAIGAAVKAVVAEGNLISSAADIADIAFVGTSGSENPMYANFEVSLGNFYVASNSSLKVLKDDPRLSKFYDLAPNANKYVGIDQGGIDALPFTVGTKDFSQPTSLTYRKDAPVIFMSDWEVWFLRAEAALLLGTGDNSEAAFKNAIESSFSYTGASGATAFIDALEYGVKTDGDKLKLIATQKWVSMNGLQEAEAWAEARRHDTPDTKIFSSANGLWATPLKSALGAGVFPNLYLYPETEQSFNPNAPTQRALTEKAFWDN